MDDPYTYETSVAVRFRDLDVMDQVHNAVLLVYVEEARIRYFREVVGVELERQNGAIVRQEIDYTDTITLDSSVTVRYRVSRIGESSMTMAFEVHTDDGKAAEGEVVHVMLDDADDPRPIPDAWRDRVRTFEDAPPDGI